MIKLRQGLLVGILALGGCAGQTPATVGGVGVTQAQLDAVRAAYDGAFLAPAAKYRQLGYCPAGTKATLAAPCADRAVVAKLRAVDAKVSAGFTALQVAVAAGQGAGALAALTKVEGLVASAQGLISGLGVGR